MTDKSDRLSVAEYVRVLERRQMESELWPMERSQQYDYPGSDVDSSVIRDPTDPGEKGKGVRGRGDEAEKHRSRPSFAPWGEASKYSGKPFSEPEWMSSKGLLSSTLRDRRTDPSPSKTSSTPPPALSQSHYQSRTSGGESSTAVAEMWLNPYRQNYGARETEESSFPATGTLTGNSGSDGTTDSEVDATATSSAVTGGSTKKKRRPRGRKGR
ncbi:hypothetical protein IAU59_005671 [Kwoniella sp. CBS 9459]